MECISDDNEVWPDLLYVHVEDVEGPYDPNDVDPATRKACEAWLSRDFEQEQREEQEFYRMIDGRNREAVQWELDQKRLYTRVLTPPPSPPHQPHPPNGEKKPEVTTQSRHIQPPSNRIHKPSKKPANIVELRKARRKAQREVIRRPATRSMRAELVALDPDQRNRVTVFGMESDVSMEFSEYAIVQVRAAVPSSLMTGWLTRRRCTECANSHCTGCARDTTQRYHIASQTMRMSQAYHSPRGLPNHLQHQTATREGPLGTFTASTQLKMHCNHKQEVEKLGSLQCALHYKQEGRTLGSLQSCGQTRLSARDKPYLIPRTCYTIWWCVHGRPTERKLHAIQYIIRQA